MMAIRPSAQPNESDPEYLNALGEVPGWLSLVRLLDRPKLNLRSSAVSDAG
jgi:hypothetical protein